MWMGRGTVLFPWASGQVKGRMPFMLNATQFTELRQSFCGELIHAEHAAYEAARRVWNGNIDRRPAVIARCTGVADVQCAVNFAREQGLRLSVRGGGHSAPGYGTNDGGL